MSDQATLLEGLGKSAAEAWGRGKSGTLTEAVVASVKNTALTTEQVRRVIEHTNTHAFLQEFHRGGTNRVVTFPGGPADPHDVLHALSDGGSTVSNDGLNDYRMPPPARVHPSSGLAPDTEKLASSEIWDNPTSDLVNVHSDFRDLVESTTLDLYSAQNKLAQHRQEMWQQTKEACVDYGVPFADVIYSLASVAPDAESVKFASMYLANKLEELHGFTDEQFEQPSLTKTASEVDVDHPLLQAFVGWCASAEKVASLTEQLEDMRFGEKETASLLSGKEASAKADAAKGLIPWIKNTAAHAGEHVTGPAAASVTKLVTGNADHAATAAKAVGGATKYAPHVAGGLLAYNLYDRATESPTLNKALSLVPGTQEHDQAKQIRMMQAAGQYY